MNETQGWREVSKDEFYRAMSNQDVHPLPIGSWPYTSLFKTRNRMVRGKVVGYFPEGKGLPENQYWLPT